MKTSRKVPIVKESAKYDDLLDASPKTKRLLSKIKSGRVAGPAKTKGVKPSKTNPPHARRVKVKIASQVDADSFAEFMQQNLYAKSKSITFSGFYDAKQDSAVVAAKVKSTGPFVFTDLSAEEKEKILKAKLARRNKLQKKSKWNQTRFFEEHWVEMPPFSNEEVAPLVEFQVSFKSARSHKAWLKLTGETGKSFWFNKSTSDATSSEKLMWLGKKGTSAPRYPVYIISKGRAQYGPLTAKVFQRLGIPFYLMVEPHEYNKYRTLCDWATEVLVIGESNHGMGPGRARNACWDHAKNVLKSKRHWVLDDNIADFYRLHDNTRIRVGDGTVFRAAEDFVDRYKNVAVAGFAYNFFHVATSKQYPFKLNTRIYSCLLIDNECPYRWRGRYNEDTILSLDVLKDFKKHKSHDQLNKKISNGKFKTHQLDRYATVEFVSFLQGKLNTQVQKGGNTAEFYSKEKTGPKSTMLAEVHPDVAHVKDMFNRTHHKVDYTVFRNNWLKKTDEWVSRLKIIDSKKSKSIKNHYGMKLVKMP